MTNSNDLICTWPSCGHTARGQCQHINAVPAAPVSPEVLALVEAARVAADDLDGYVGQSYGDYLRAALAAWNELQSSKEASHDR